MDYTVRLATQQEIPGLADIERAAAQQFLPYLSWLGIPANLLEGLTSLSFLLRAQADNRLWVAIATENTAANNREQVVGFIVVKYLLKSCFIVELDVHPDYTRQGIGSALLMACCQGARLRGFDQVTLTTFRKVPWNIPFYQRSGFEVITPQAWPLELAAIVQHETRYGFAREKRAVMGKRILPADQLRSPTNEKGTAH